VGISESWLPTVDVRTGVVAESGVARGRDGPSPRVFGQSIQRLGAAEAIGACGFEELGGTHEVVTAGEGAVPIEEENIAPARGPRADIAAGAAEPAGIREQTKIGPVLGRLPYDLAGAIGRAAVGNEDLESASGRHLLPQLPEQSADVPGLVQNRQYDRDRWRR
jgi:hypothetical protein